MGFQTRGFFQLWPVRHPPLQPVCSSSPGSVHSPSETGAVGSDPGFYRDSAYVVVMPALMCLGAEGLMHAADICVHSDGCGASLAAPAASCLPPRPRLLGARAACPASLPRACKFVLLSVGWAAGCPWPRRKPEARHVLTLLSLSCSRASFLLPFGSFLTPSSPLSSWNSCANTLGSKWSPEGGLDPASPWG